MIFLFKKRLRVFVCALKWEVAEIYGVSVAQQCIFRVGVALLCFGWGVLWGCLF